MIFFDKHKQGCFILLLMCSRSLFADQCPIPEIIKDRKISRDYEWTIDERRTLDDVLAIETLFSVRIKNNGEFVACYYSSSRGILRLDAKPEKKACRVNKKAGSWDSASSEYICKEDDLALCVYEIACKH